eukprot:COSAG06_NODE_692_length_13043_cov_369.439509_6_plen_188_part_00
MQDKKHDQTRHDKTRDTRQDKTRQETRQDKRQDKTRLGGKYARPGQNSTNHVAVLQHVVSGGLRGAPLLLRSVGAVPALVAKQNKTRTRDSKRLRLQETADVQICAAKTGRPLPVLIARMNLASSAGVCVLVGTHHTHILPGVSRMKASPELSIEETSSTCSARKTIIQRATKLSTIMQIRQSRLSR